MNRLVRLQVPVLLLLAAPLLGGCVGRSGCCPQAGAATWPGPTAAVGALPEAVEAVPEVPMPATPPASHALLDGDGNDVAADAALKAALAGDVVAFGELHGHPVGAALELKLLQAMHASGRPVALAMEFFERDTQEALDAWLAGSLDDDAFLAATRQGKAYAKTHGPLLDYCKAHGIPVIAANAPRPLVKAYRKQEAPYAEWIASLTEAERATLPRSTSTPDDAYRETFMKLMGPKRGPSFFRSQALWDDAMGEAVADYRAAHPETAVLLVVGAFHVTRRLGTVTKLLERQPGDRVHVMVMKMAASELNFDDSHRDAGDVVVLVRRPAASKP